MTVFDLTQLGDMQKAYAQMAISNELIASVPPQALRAMEAQIQTRNADLLSKELWQKYGVKIDSTHVIFTTQQNEEEVFLNQTWLRAYWEPRGPLIRYTESDGFILLSALAVGNYSFGGTPPPKDLRVMPTSVLPTFEKADELIDSVRALLCEELLLQGWDDKANGWVYA